jgi:hypothetical protein
MILPPMMKDTYDDRDSDCQMALDVTLKQVIDNAETAGWKRIEVMTAIINLAINFLAAEAKNGRTDFRIAQALGRVEH